MPRVRIQRLAEVADRFDVLLVDVWGVLHDGDGALPGVVECLRRQLADGRRVIVFSNAARRRDAIAAELVTQGIPADCYSDIVSSGELTWQYLGSRPHRYGRRCWYLGPERSAGLLDGLALERVASPADADFILNAGVEGNPPDSAPYAGLLRRLFEHRLPMLCANPDRIAIRHGAPGIAAGALARDYAALGGTVEYLGKPHPPMYRAAAAICGNPPPSRVLAIGDGMETDIAGGAASGHPTLLVERGVHRTELAAGGLDELCRTWNCRPDWIIATLR